MKFEPIIPGGNWGFSFFYNIERHGERFIALYKKKDSTVLTCTLNIIR